MIIYVTPQTSYLLHCATRFDLLQRHRSICLWKPCRRIIISIQHQDIRRSAISIADSPRDAQRIGALHVVDAHEDDQLLRREIRRHQRQRLRNGRRSGIVEPLGPSCSCSSCSCSCSFSSGSYAAAFPEDQMKLTRCQFPPALTCRVSSCYRIGQLNSS